MQTIGYFGWYRNNEIPINVTEKDIELSITKIKCIECNGVGKVLIPNGHSGILYSEEYPCPMKVCDCVVCKGSGYVYINC